MNTANKAYLAQAEEHRGDVVITFNNLIVLSHKILLYTQVCNSQQPILTSSVASMAVRVKYIEFCFTVHFNSLNVTHQLLHFQYNNILV